MTGTHENDAQNRAPEAASADEAAWRAAVERELAGKSAAEQALVTRLLEGVELAALSHDHGPSWPGAGSDGGGFPGFAPYLRGSEAVPTQQWDVRQQIAGPTPLELAEAVAEELQGGDSSSVHITLDAVAQTGLEPLSTQARPLSGATGAALYSLPMLAEAVPASVAATNVRLDGGAAFLPVAAMHAALLQKKRNNEATQTEPGVAADLFIADPLAALAGNARLPVSLETAFDHLAALVRWCRARLPEVRCVRVCTLCYHDAGATETQEMAAALATGVAYLRALTERGISLDEAAARISFEVRVEPDLYVGLAKLRALRALWAQVLQACGSTEPEPIKLYAATSWRTMTQRDPWVNLLRGASAAFAAVCGGVDGLRVVPFDAALGEPDRFGRRLARTTQLVLQAEAHLGKVADPAGGAWSLERLTEDLAREAYRTFQEIERRGGIATVLLDGSWYRDVDQAHTARMKEIATRNQPIVGVSEYPLVAETPAETYKLPAAEALAEEVEQAWQKAVSQRDEAGVQAALARLDVAENSSAWAGEGGVALFDALVEAATAGASVAEMAQRLGFAAQSGVAAERLEEAFAPRRLAEPFEALRDAADVYAEAHHGTRPRVFLVNLGTPAQHSARAAFADGFAQAGGLEVLASDGILAEGAGEEGCVDIATGVQQFRESGASVAVLCGSDASYVELVPQLAPQLKQAGCTWLVLAGHAGEHAEAWQAAGLNQTIYRGSDVLATLRQWHAKLGV